MDFEAITRLGDRLQGRFRAANYDELAFCDLASDALAGHDDTFRWDPSAIAAYLARATVAQDPAFEFSNLPLILYRCPTFYIELLVWTRGTTAIHEHGFSGAFKVVAGSSLHTRYGFSAERRINHRLWLGRVECLGAEYLQKGSIRPIYPGAEGLCHSLFHLDHPSATLVIRTQGIHSYLPQRTLAAPCFAYSEPEMDRDPRIDMFRRLLDTALDIDRDGFVGLLTGDIPALDFPTLFVLALDRRGLLGPGEEASAFFAAVARHHGEPLAGHLRDAIDEALRVDGLRAARRGTRDEGLRFFLALLMNLRTRAQVLDMLAQRFPGESPGAQCAALLARLCEQRQEASRLLARLAASSGVGEYRLGARVAGALPDAPEMAERASRLEAALFGDGEDPLSRRLAAIDELAPLFTP